MAVSRVSQKMEYRTVMPNIESVYREFCTRTSPGSGCIPEMFINQPRNVRRKLDDKVVLAAVQHVQAATGKQLLQIRAHCHGADGVGIAPQQQCWRANRADANGQILMVVS